MFYIGCHLSASDGFLAMGRTALSIGANTFQFFTRNPRGSKAKAIDPADVAAFLALAAENEFGTLVAHAPYTINPCSKDEHTREFARMTLADDLKRMEHLPGNVYNFHPGSHTGQGMETGIAQIAETLNAILTPDIRTTVLLARAARWAAASRSCGRSSTGWSCRTSWGCVWTPAMCPTRGTTSRTTWTGC